MRRYSFLSLVFSPILACSRSAVPSGGACTTVSQCASGLFCTHGKCTSGSAGQSCVTAKDCQAGDVCESSVCTTTTAAPSITAVRGDTASATDPGAHSGYVVHSGFVVTGTGFNGTHLTAKLVDAASKAYSLVVNNAEATSFSAAIPAELATAVNAAGSAGATFQLVVTTDAGSVARDVSILQGEQGPAGGDTSTLDARYLQLSGGAVTGTLDASAGKVKLPVRVVYGTDGSQGYTAYVACDATEIAIGGGCGISPNPTNDIGYFISNCPGDAAEYDGEPGDYYPDCNYDNGTPGAHFTGSPGYTIHSVGWYCHTQNAPTGAGTPILNAFAICLKSL